MKQSISIHSGKPKHNHSLSSKIQEGRIHYLSIVKALNFVWDLFGELTVSVKLTLKVLVTTIDAQWEGMGDVGSARYEPALLPPCPTITVLSYSN